MADDRGYPPGPDYPPGEPYPGAPGYGRPLPARSAIDPFVAGVSDGVAHGYQAIEHVVWGLQESLRMQARPRLARGPLGMRPPVTRYGRPAGGRPVPPRAPVAGRPPGTRAMQPQTQAPTDAHPLGPGAVGYPGGGYAGGYSPYGRPLALGLLDDLSAVFVDLLNRAAGAAHDVADAITQQTHYGSAAGAPSGCIPELALAAPAGQHATVRFNLWNTGAGALRSVRFDATDLLGSAGRIGIKTISFTPALVDFVRPGGSAVVVIVVAVPPEAVPGVYRGLVQAEPGDSCVILELTVADPAATAHPSMHVASHPATDAPPPGSEAE